MTHPSERFFAPSSIQSGTPLKQLFNKKSVTLMAESLATIHVSFDSEGFITHANSGLSKLELFPRVKHIAQVLQKFLPTQPRVAAQLLVTSLGPELTVNAGFGLRPFFYLPHVFFIHTHLIDDFSAGMSANYAITKRFSAEFSIRPYLMRYPQATLEQLHVWAADPNAHVRRLVSEGTRPRLPWAERLPIFIKDPKPTLQLLELLKDDPELYVRRSVANHLGDIAKDHPTIAFDTCRRWLDETPSLPSIATKYRRALIRHAMRLPARKGEKNAVKIRRDAGGR